MIQHQLTETFSLYAGPIIELPQSEGTRTPPLLSTLVFAVAQGTTGHIQASGRFYRGRSRAPAQRVADGRADCRSYAKGG